MTCDLPSSDSLIMTEEKHFHLSLQVTGLKQEILTYSLSQWITFHPNIILTGLQTSESGLVFEGIDTFITVALSTTSMFEIECLFYDSVQEIFHRSVLAYKDASTGLCSFDPRLVYHVRSSFELHLSANNALDFEQNPSTLSTQFTVVHSPVLESIELSQGYASLAN